MKIIKQAVILAGGRGSRLRPFTDTNPKPMVPINGRPFLEHLIEMLKENGIKEVVILTGYLSEKIQEYFGNGSKFGINIEYSFTPFEDKNGQENESGIRIKNAEHLLDDVFFLMYCDNYWPVNLKKMTDFYNQMGRLAMTTVYNNKDGFGEYGKENNVLVSDDGSVLKYDRTRKDPNLNGVDMGFFILNKKIIDLIPEHNSHFEKEILPELITENQLAAYQTDHRYYFITNENTLQIAEKLLKPKKAIFLDRDGVINKRIKGDYVRDWKQFEFLPGVIEGLKLLCQNDFQTYIITNQRGISRGLMTEHDLNDIHQKMKQELKKHNVIINKIYYCPHEKGQCDCRKPKPGMLFKAANENYLDLSKTIFIGDSETDLQAGQAVGCKTILIKPGQNLLEVIKQV